MNNDARAQSDSSYEAEDSFLDGIDILDVLAAILKAWPLLFCFVIVGYVIGRFNAFTAPSVYKTDALLQIEHYSNQARIALSQTASVVEQSTALPAEIEILRSRKVLGDVARRRGLDIEVQPSFLPYIGEAIWRNHHGAGFGLPPPWLKPLVRKRHAWGGESITVSTFEVPKSLENANFSISPTGNDNYDLLQGDSVKLGEGRVGERLIVEHPEGNIELFVQTLNSPNERLFFIRKLPTQIAAARIGNRLRAHPRSSGSNGSILEMTITSIDPDEATLTLGKILDVFQQQNVERRSAEAEKTLEFLEKQLPELRKQVETAEARLNRFKIEQGTADLTQETSLVLTRSVEIENQINDLISKREEALRNYTENHPVVQALAQQIAVLRATLERVEQRVRQLPEAQQKALRLTRDVDVLSALYVSLLNRSQELEVVKSGTIGNVRIIDPPVKPLAPSGPNRGALLGAPIAVMLMLGVGLVVTRYFMHNGVQDSTQVEQRLGIPTFGSIPYSKVQTKLLDQKKRGNHSAHPLLAIADSQCVAMEAIRSTRTGLYFTQMDAKNNAVMITGPEPSVGKSFVSANLATAIATAGKRTLLIDADMRRGTLHEMFDTPRDGGLSEILSGQAEADKNVQQTTVDNLSLLTSGTIPPNPAELLINDRLAQLLDKLQSQYEFIIIDTPPILAVTDAAIIGRLTGTSFIVLKAGEHSMRMIEDAVKRVMASGAQVTGTIFNQLGRGAGGYGGKYSAKYGHYQYRYQ